MSVIPFKRVSVILPFGLPWQGFGPARNATELSLFLQRQDALDVLVMPKGEGFGDHVEALGIGDRTLPLFFFGSEDVDNLMNDIINSDDDAVVSISTPLNGNTTPEFRERYLEGWKKLRASGKKTLHVFVEHQPYVFSKGKHYDEEYVREFSEASTLSLSLSSFFREYSTTWNNRVEVMPFDGLELPYFIDKFWKPVEEVDIKRLGYYGRYSRLKNGKEAVKYLTERAYSPDNDMKLVAEGITGGIWTKEIFFENALDKALRVEKTRVEDYRKFSDNYNMVDNRSLAWDTAQTDTLRVFSGWDWEKGLDRISKTGFTMSMFNMRATSRKKNYQPGSHACLENIQVEAIASGSVLVSDESLPRLFFTPKGGISDELLVFNDELTERIRNISKDKKTWDNFRQWQLEEFRQFIDADVIYADVLNKLAEY